MFPWPYPKFIAHRGGGRLAPENTLAAIETGVRLGHRMIEIDAKLSRDNHVFLLHDDTLERTTNGKGIAGDLPWDVLTGLDAGSWFSGMFRGTPLPRLAQVAECCRRHALAINIEIKPTTGTERETGEIVAYAARDWWRGMTAPLLSSFSIEALEAAQAAAPDLPRGLLLHEWRDDWQALTTHLQCVSLHLNHDLIDATRAAEIKAAGLRILAYTVNLPERATELLQWGVDAICTDAIDVIGPEFKA